MNNYQKELLAEHKSFRNQLIVATILMLIVCIWVPEMLGHTIVLGLIAIYNIFSYNKNLKDYKTINEHKNKL